MKRPLLLCFLIVHFWGFSQLRIVQDFQSGAGDANPYNFIEFNNRLYYYTDNTGLTSERCHVSDGTDKGTSVLVDTNGNELIAQNTNSNTDWIVLNNELFFPAQNITDGVQLYKTDGTNNSASLVKRIHMTASSNPKDFTLLGNAFLFTANDGVAGRELWISNGDGDGTTLLKDIASGSGSSIPENLLAFNGMVYFRANDGTNGQELWISDGTSSGTVMLKDIAPGSTNSTPRDFIGFNGKVYFTANDGTNGRELWVTDGTAAGTVMVDDLNSGSAGSLPYELTVFNDNLVFAATSSLGTELVKMNPQETITSLGNINPSGDSDPQDLTVYNGRLYFSADNGSVGRELFSTNGFSTNTVLEVDIQSGTNSSNPNSFVVYNGKLYFSADDGATGNELWVFDSTTGNASLVEDLVSSGGSSPIPTIVYNNELFLSMDVDGDTGIELWAYIDPEIKTSVPDDNFEQLLISLGKDDVLDDLVSTGQLLTITSLTANGNAGVIADFTGIEAMRLLDTFTSLNNTSTSIDLSQNRSLTEIFIQNQTNLTALTISKENHRFLESLSLLITGLTSLDISGFESLDDIDLQNNLSLTSVNASNLTAPSTSFGLQGSSSLNSLDIGNSTGFRSLILNNLSITSVDISAHVNLESLALASTDVQSLDMSNNTLASNVFVQNNSQMTDLSVKNGANNVLVTFTATGNGSLSCINVDNETDANAGNGVYGGWNVDTGIVFSESCSTLSLNEELLKQVSLYPNPAKDRLQLQLQNLVMKRYEIVDLTGRIVLAQTGHFNEIEIDRLKSGIYLMNIQTEQGKIVKKIIKSGE